MRCVRGFGPCASAVVLVGVLASNGVAGDLNPPPGPVSGTFKTLTEVEPRTAINGANTPGDAGAVYKITAPGSYYLTDDVAGEANKHGIEITASDVTIDLMGFAVRGVPDSISGICASAPDLETIAISNGVVRSWGLYGIDLSQAVHSDVQDVRAVSNAAIGIYCEHDAIVRGCIAAENTGLSGIWVGAGSVVTDCVATGNLAGFQGYGGAVFTRCAASGNLTGGFAVIDSEMRECTSSSNETVGVVGTGSTLSDCEVAYNKSHGIRVENSVVSGCMVLNNWGDGIRAMNGCSVVRNTLTGNGVQLGAGAGIHVQLGENRIDDNMLRGNQVGVWVESSGNVLLRNTCHGSVGNNWDIAAGNACQVIVISTGSAFTGNSGGMSPYGGGTGTKDDANFTY